MNPLLTNSEFQEAFSSLGIHHAPESYWDEITKRRKHDKVKIRGSGESCPKQHTRHGKPAADGKDVITMEQSEKTLDMIVNLCKNRG